MAVFPVFFSPRHGPERCADEGERRADNKSRTPAPPRPASALSANEGAAFMERSDPHQSSAVTAVVEVASRRTSVR